MANLPDSQALKAREKYVLAFNSTMVRIWKEKIVLLDAVRSGALYASVIKVAMDNRDGRFLDVTLSQQFNLYGLFVNYGTGREIYRGNKGDIGVRADGSKSGITSKKRRAKPWFSPKYYSSVMNIREFYADNLGREGAYVIANQLNPDNVRKGMI